MKEGKEHWLLDRIWN